MSVINVSKANLQPVAIEDLKYAAGNSKVHTTEQIQAIADSIKKFGYRDPIAVREDMTIIEGHGRVAACKLLGLDSVPAFIIPMDADDATVYGYIHNKLTLDTPLNVELAMSQIYAGTDAEQAAQDAVLCGFSDTEVQLFQPDSMDTSKVYFGNNVADENIAAMVDNTRGKKVLLKFANTVEYEAFMQFLTRLKAAIPSGESHADRLLTYVKTFNTLQG